MEESDTKVNTNTERYRTEVKGLEEGGQRVGDRIEGSSDSGDERLGDNSGGESSEEIESFEGWRSSCSDRSRQSLAVATGVAKGSVSARSSVSAHETMSPGQSGSGGSSLRPSESHEAPSSTTTGGWIGQRPSADTPLKHGGEHHVEYHGQDHHGQKQHRISKALEDVGGTRLSVSLDHSQRTSGGSSVGYGDLASSARSSFALERADINANRKSLEAFQVALRKAAKEEEGKSPPPQPAIPQRHSDDVKMKQQMQPDTGQIKTESAQMLSIEQHVQMLEQLKLPNDMVREAGMLAVLPPQTPAPVSMLALLWRKSPEDTEALLMQLASLGIVKVAHLPDGKVWGLPQQKPLHIFQEVFEAEISSFNQLLVKSYAEDCQKRRGLEPSEITDIQLAETLAYVRNDGYIITNLSYHLISAKMAGVARSLLLNPDWLERKFIAAGPYGVVSDFRRYLNMHPDKDVKLVLEAFQMSVGILNDHRIPGLLRCQLVGRLMVAPLTQAGKEWLAYQERKIKETDLPIVPVPVLNPSLDQAGGLQRLCLKGHTGPITQVLLTPSGTEAISSSDDGTARVWDLEIGDCMLLLEGHTGSIGSMSVTADGSLLVTASEDGTARAYELEKGQCLRVLAAHKGPISCMTIDPFGRFVCTGGVDMTLRIWDLVSAAAIHILRLSAPTSSMALSSCTKKLLVCCNDGSVHLIDIAQGACLVKMEGHTARVIGSHLFVDGKRALTASEDGSIKVWSVRSGRLVRQMEGHKGPIDAFKVSNDDSVAISGSDDGTARVWDLKSGVCLKVLDAHKGWVVDLAIPSRNDKVISASPDGSAIEWDMDSGGVKQVLEGHSGGVNCVQVTKKGRFAITGSDDCSVRVWDLSAPTSHIPHWHVGRIRVLSGRNGKLIATSGDDCLARLWDAAVGEFQGTLDRHTVPIRWSAFSSDGSNLLTASPNRELYVWDTETKEVLYKLPEHHGSRVKSISVSGDLKRAVICLFDSTVSVWDLVSAEITCCIQKWGQRDASRGHSSAVNNVFITSDGKTVVTVSKDWTARIWDADTGECLHKLEGHSDSVIGVAVDEVSQIMATFSLDNSVHVWCLRDGGHLGNVEVNHGIQQVAISFAGDIAIALDNGVIAMAKVDKLKDLRRLQVHTNDITGLAFTEDGKYVVSSSLDCTLKIVDFADASGRGVFAGDCAITCFYIDEATSHIAAGTDKGIVMFIDASPAFLPR